MARLTPTVRGATLVDSRSGKDEFLAVGTPAWYAWLATASSFTFQSDSGSFLARNERAGNRRGGWYWKAYRTQHGVLSSRYLGKSEALTLERLNAAARMLASSSRAAAEGEMGAKAVAPVPTSVRDDSVLTSELRLPRLPPQHVGRARLIARLEQALERPLTLIAAPAGFGNSAAASSTFRSVK